MSVTWLTGGVATPTIAFNSGVLTLSVPTRTDYTGSYILQRSTDGGVIYTSLTSTTTTNNNVVSFVLNPYLFDGNTFWRVYTPTGSPPAYSAVYEISTGAPEPTPAPVPCFLGNAPVLTPTGYRRIDSLREGDLIQTPAGATVPIQRVSITVCAAGPSTNPYVIPKGRFGAERTLLISPNHKVAVDGAMVEARHLGLQQKEREGTLRYYNLELPAYENMIVAGVEVESLAPVRRIPVTLAQLTTLLTRKYGAAASSADVIQKVMRTCRMRADGRVDIPVIRK